MRHLTNLNKLNLLSPEQKLWFKSPKSSEEFYDLENDPFENTNIAKGNEELIKEFETRISEIEKNEISHDDELSEEDVEYETPVAEDVEEETPENKNEENK